MSWRDRESNLWTFGSSIPADVLSV